MKKRNKKVIIEDIKLDIIITFQDYLINTKKQNQNQKQKQQESKKEFDFLEYKTKDR